MTDDKRTEQQIIAESYSDEARATWKAPVQVGRCGTMYIPWDIHLEAYEAYCKKWSKQTALIDLKGRGCRGGFGTEELDGFVPGWRDRVSAIGKMQVRLAALEASNDKRGDLLEDLSEKLSTLSGGLQKTGWLDTTANYLQYDAVAKAMITIMENEQ